MEETCISGTEQSSQTDPHRYGRLILDKSARTTKGKRIIFSPNAAGIMEHPYVTK